jgi:L-glyceraldehyde 3-phosphate reductase
MAYAWVLRDPRVTTTPIGASSPEQVRENVALVAKLAFTPDELAEIDRHAIEGGVNLREKPSFNERAQARGACRRPAPARHRTSGRHS